MPPAAAWLSSPLNAAADGARRLLSLSGSSRVAVCVMRLRLCAAPVSQGVSAVDCWAVCKAGRPTMRRGYLGRWPGRGLRWACCWERLLWPTRSEGIPRWVRWSDASATRHGGNPPPTATGGQAVLTRGYDMSCMRQLCFAWLTGTRVGEATHPGPPTSHVLLRSMGPTHPAARSSSRIAATAASSAA